jgi:CRP/FNR family transcriptional regulator, cyclic AMP receptor protein
MVDERERQAGAGMRDLGEDPINNTVFLGALDLSDRRYLAEQGCRKRLDKGQILFTEGAVSDSVLVLISGQLKVVTYSAAGSEFMVNTVMPGETIGEMGVLSGAPRSATVQATEASVVLSLPKSVMIDLISRRPGLAIALLVRLSDMVRRTTGLASDLIFLDLRQRVAKYLLQHDLDRSRAVGRRVTQSDIAAHIGASRQRVNSCLRDFHDQGWIRVEPRKLRVVDRTALTRIVSD